MKIKQKRILQFLLLFLGLFTVNVLYAPMASADDASDYCNAKYGNQKSQYSDDKLADRCITGYNRGVGDGTKPYAANCGSYGDAIDEPACLDGYKAGDEGVKTPQQAQQTKTYCENAYGSNADRVQTCKDGYFGADCSKQATPGTKDACAAGKAQAICGLDPRRTSTTNEQRECMDGAQDCVASGKTGDELNQCLNDVPGANESAVDGPVAAENEDGSGGNGGAAAGGGSASKCGKAETVLITCDEAEGGAALGGVLGQVVTILSAAVGAIAVGGIVYGAILYTSAGDNAGQTTQAIGIIRNVAIGIALYIFMMALITWIVPGGVV